MSLFTLSLYGLIRLACHVVTLFTTAAIVRINIAYVVLLSIAGERREAKL